ncbi:MAG TPA: porin family protein [Bacteroidales bacterium]|nr:porin family protein [Bacteroidales bacterium]
MKTKVYLSFIIIAFILPLNLQGQVLCGVHAGMNLETQAENGLLWNNCEVSPGYIAGGTLTYQFKRGISLQSELNYQRKGVKVVSSLNETNKAVKTSLNYLSVPLLIKKSVNSPAANGSFEVTFFGGPYVAYLLSAESRKTDSPAEEEAIEAQEEKYDSGILLGGGTSYILNNGSSINVELRYGMGLAKIDKSNTDLRNKSLGLIIGYFF